jgi:hypothetical protein
LRNALAPWPKKKQGKPNDSGSRCISKVLRPVMPHAIINFRIFLTCSHHTVEAKQLSFSSYALLFL